MHFLKSSAQLANVDKSKRQVLLAALTLLASSSLVFLAGCGIGNSPIGASTTSLAIQGSVHGGAQPVKGSTITLYAANQTAYAGASTVLTTTTTDSAGNFSITGTYTCPANSQVYIAAAGGDPGTGVSNPQLALAAGLGTCSGTLSSGLLINLNEVTTVATAYALSGFATDLAHVGTSATNVLGLKNAMNTIGNIVNITSGAARTITPAYAAGTDPNFKISFVPQPTINTLADILSACVNSSGGSACNPLFSAVSGTTPTDTFQAALRIAQNPGQKISQIYAVLPPTIGQPFQPTISSVPNDWTISVIYVGGGLGGSATNNRGNAGDLKIDGSGNVWITGLRAIASNNPLGGRLYELDPLGAPLSPSTAAGATTPAGFSGGGLNNPLQLAIDLEGDAWAQSAVGNISAFSPAGTPLSFSPVTDNSINGVAGLSIDGLDQVWYYTPGSTNVLGKISHAGSILSGTGYTGGVSGPSSIAINASNHVFVVNGGNSTMSELDNNGALVANGNPGAFVNGPLTKQVVDAGGNKWFSQSAPENLVKTDTVLTSANAFQFSAADLLSANAMAMDGGNNVWVANAGNGTVIGFKNDGSLITPLSTGYLVNPFSTNQTGAAPVGLGVDPSGNVWVVMQNRYDTGAGGQSDVQEFIGAAVPAVTPIALAVKNNKLGQRP